MRPAGEPPQDGNKPAVPFEGATGEESAPGERRRRKGKGSKKKRRRPASPKHFWALAGGGLAAATLLVVAIVWAVAGRGGASNGDADEELGDGLTVRGSAVVIDRPDSNVKPVAAEPIPDSAFAPPQPLPVVRATLALALPVTDGVRDELAPARWAGAPDPPAKRADPPPPEFARFYQGSPLFASGDGPYFVLFTGDWAGSGEIARAKDDNGLGVEEGNSPRQFVRLMDLRTGKQAARFSWRVPLWHPCRLSPEGTYIVGPNPAFPAASLANDGLLIAWKREAPEPVTRMKMPGKVAWMDFLDDNRFGVLTFDPSPVLQVWDLAASKPVQSVSLPEEELPVPRAYNEAPGKAEPLAFTPRSVAGAVSPGGHQVALGGLKHIFVIAGDGILGALRWPALVNRTKTPESRDYMSLGFSPDGRELISVLNVDDRTITYLARWSMETGRVRGICRMTAGPGKGAVYGGPPLPGPAPGTLILPRSLLGFQGEGDRPGAILDASDGSLVAKLRHVTVRVLDGGASRLVYGSFEHETRPDIDQKTPPWKKDPDAGKLTAEERRQWEGRAKLGTAIYVAPIDRAPFAERLVARAADDRPPAGQPDRTGLVVSKAEPPAAWEPLPAPAAPLAEARSVPNVLESRPYFGLTHVAFLDGRKKLEDAGPQAGLNWHRVDLRKEAAPSISVPLWPWATAPGAKDDFDAAKTVPAAAMSNDGEMLALRDPSNPARVDVWRATGERIAGFRPYDTRPIDWVSWSPGGRLLTLGDGKLTGWDAATARAVYEVAGDYRLPVEPARGRRWLVVSCNGRLDLLDAETGRCLGRIPTGDTPADPYQSLALSPDGTVLALCCRGDAERFRQAPFPGFGLLRAWNLTTGKEQEPIVLQRLFGWPIFLPDNGRVLMARGTYDLASGLPAEVFNFYGPLGLGPDGRLWTFDLPNPDAPARPAPPPVPGKPPAAPGPAGDPKATRGNLRAIDFAPKTAGKPLDRAWLCDKRSPISVEVDVGDAQRSLKMAQNMVARLMAEGFTVGPGGFRLKAREREVVTNLSGAHAPFLGNQPVPGIEVTWSLHGPNGTQVWRLHKLAEFTGQSRYAKGSRKTGKRIGMMEEVVTEYDFGGRNPREALLEELREKSVGLLMDLPPARYYPPADTPQDKGWLDLPVVGTVRFVN
jgi:WD40 repeat protein